MAHIKTQQGVITIMFEIKGKYGNAKVFTDNVEDKVVEQVKGMLNEKITENTKVRIMPDTHYGKGATVGTTIKLPENVEEWKISPNVIGVDIGCSMMSVKLSHLPVTLEELDKVVNKVVPAGFNVHQKPVNQELVDELLRNITFPINEQVYERISLSLGTLGGGNHFIELAKDEDDELWLTVHSGSRHLGVLVANHHQKIAEKSVQKINSKELIQKLKDEGRQTEIQNALKNLVSPVVNKQFSYLEGELLDDYLIDMDLAQKYAAFNREYMLRNILDEIGLDFDKMPDHFDSIHNFIDIKNGIARKGATSANKGERLIIPLNMRDGSLICVGKGNPDWNYSAPHGAGRQLSRSKAKEVINIEEFKDTMSGIYSTSIGLSTLDEAPEAYKPMNDIISNISDTVDIVHHLKPIYNFKAH